ncbi:polysaccharide biosynthesis/export family protein [Methylobacterium sp.]|uniref:polysaccharide biosynthesis/export family protein n=1 Tax=Methylobacterium sp. TaxID=409 RepID=UPI003B004F8E
MRQSFLYLTTLLFGATIISCNASDGTDYNLGPQDRITVRVYDMRKNIGEAYAWTALNGEFSVSSNGYISMPIIGNIEAANKTTEAVAVQIGKALKQAADLSELPIASVEIAKYRPFYTYGAVQQPGQYDFVPGLNVLQAVSLSGGLLRDATSRQAVRDALTSDGELRALEAELVGLQARKARLDAEIGGMASFNPEKDVQTSKRKNGTRDALIEQKLIFDVRKNNLNAAVNSVEQGKASINQELAALAEKGRTLDRQIDLSRRDLNLVNDLVQKGLAVTPRQLAAEQLQSSYQSSRLDISLATFRAQQNLASLDRDLVEITGRYRKESLDDAALSSERIAQLKEKILTATRLLNEAEERSSRGGTNISSMQVTYRIHRSKPGGTDVSSVLENAILIPGDVLEVNISQTN